MKKNIFKKFIVLLSLGFVLFGFNFTNATAEENPNPAPLECSENQILNEAGDACVDVPEEPQPLVCVLPKILNETGDECIDSVPTPEPLVCVPPQILNDIGDTCIEPTPDPVPENIVHSITVKNGCTVKDTEGIDHVFPKDDSVSEFLGVCALVSAKEAGYINDFELTNDSSFGLYLSSINSEKPSSTEYWALFINDGYASCGIGCLPVLVNDTLSFILSDWMAGTESTKISFKITALEDITPDPIPENNSGGNSGGGGSTPVKSFSVPKAISFLSSQQKSDGSFGELLYTDWVAIAVSKGDDSSLKASIKDYLINNSLDSSVITDYERRAMALMALGVNPYNDTEVNYIKKITDSFDGTQIGDTSLFNDDIFGLIVLQNAGYDESDEIIEKAISYVIEKQSSNGSWGSVDMTGAGIMALENFNDIDGVLDAIDNAENYLIESQNTDGGFDNSSSTSWAIQALSLNSSYIDEAEDAIIYLVNKQQDDGGVDGDGVDNRVWNTAYTIPAALKLSWIDILESFDKEKPEVVEQSGSTNSNDADTIVEKKVEEEPVIVSIAPEAEIVTAPEEIKVEPVKRKNPKIIIEEVLPIEDQTDTFTENINPINNNLLASAGDTNIFFKDRVIILTLVSVLVIVIGGWLTHRYFI